jgi:FKBP-type peptidyl-prolyl cis-trans isomerase
VHAGQSEEIIEDTPMKSRIIYITLFAMLCTSAAFSAAADDGATTPSGLVYKDLVIGTGEAAETDDVATIHFVGWLDDGGVKGRKFFDSYEQGRPITFRLGTEKVMPAWNIGVVGMKVGGMRQLAVPQALGYGEKGIEDLLPPHSDLILEIELVSLK